MIATIAETASERLLAQVISVVVGPDWLLQPLGPVSGISNLFLLMLMMEYLTHFGEYDGQVNLLMMPRLLSSGKENNHSKGT